MTEIAFEITHWQEAARGEDDELFAPVAEGPVLTRVHMRKRYTGELEAEAVGEMQACGRAAYLAMERVSGALAGRSGTFVLQHGATDEAAGGARQFGFVVPGSGTGELTGLHGEARITHGRLALDWEIAEGDAAAAG